jgi:hypothetical protein
MPSLQQHFRYGRLLAWLLLSVTLLQPGPLRGEDEPLRAVPDAEESDLYYSAMLKSIELDRGRWKPFSRTPESGPWFYDTQGLVRKGKTVTVSVTVYPHPNRTDLYRSVYADHTKIRKIDFITEIDCAKKSYRQPEIRVYGYYRDLLAEYRTRERKQPFSPIRPGTTTDTLRTNVCPAERKKR